MKVHRVGDCRIDGAETVSGPGAGSRVFIEGQLAAVAGDLDSHDMLGAIIPMSPGTVKVMGIPIATALMDSASPDSIGMILHPEGLPTPACGAMRTKAYGGDGSMGGGLGSFNTDILNGAVGMPDVGNIMQMGSQVVGQVMRTVGTGTGSGMMLMNNMNPNNTNPGAGDTVTSANTGQTFTFSSYYTS